MDLKKLEGQKVLKASISEEGLNLETTDYTASIRTSDPVAPDEGPAVFDGEEGISVEDLIGGEIIKISVSEESSDSAEEFLEVVERFVIETTMGNTILKFNCFDGGYSVGTADILIREKTRVNTLAITKILV